MDKKIIIAILAALVVVGGIIYYMGSGYNYGSQYTMSPQGTEQGQEPTPTVSAQLKTDVMVADNPTYGKIFVDGNGMTLYTYTKDTPGVSTCYNACAVNWPPLIENSSLKIGSNLISDKFSIIVRTDGTKQVAFEGMPLYYWLKDEKPGDANGHGVGGVWYVYKVASGDLAATPTPIPSPAY